MSDLILWKEEPIELTDEELDAVTGGFFNINFGNTGVGAVQSGARNLNVALGNIGIGNISLDVALSNIGIGNISIL